jgi:tetratricopeptide (TPR) repeat protein
MSKNNKTNRKLKRSKRKRQLSARRSARSIDMRRPVAFRSYSYEITDEPLNPPNQPTLSEETQKLYETAYEHCRAGRFHEGIVIFERLIEADPKVGRFYNNLAGCYQGLKQHAKVEELIELNYQRNREYLFAKVDYAQLCMSYGRLDQIPEIFEHKYDLKQLYPDRNLFHVQEVLAMHGVLGLYFAYIGKSETAMVYLKTLDQFAPDNPNTLALRELLLPTLLKEGFLGKKFCDIEALRVNEEMRP